MPSSKAEAGAPGRKAWLAGSLFALLASFIWAQTSPAPPPAQNPPSAPAAAPSQPPPPPPPVSVLIDPAHGGSEPGALLNATTAEKDINLSFARRLRQELA